MGFFTHLGGGRLGTVKDGAGKNLGAIVVAQSGSVGYAADGTVTTLFTLPAGTQILDINVDVTTAFNAGTTNTIKLGTTSGGAELVAATSVTSAGRESVATTGAHAAWVNVGTSDVTVYATYNQTGTAASAGAATISIVYVVRNSDGSIGNLP